MSGSENATSDADFHDAVESLEQLGLTTYEAKVFITLQRLRTGTAREVNDATSVPRSQVYATAESLESQGLIEIQQSNPITYKPVDITEARELLTERFEREQNRAFSYVEQAISEGTGIEEREDIWTISGAARINNRAVSLIETANDRLILGTGDTRHFPPEVCEALASADARGVSVSVLSDDGGVNEIARDLGVATEPARGYRPSDDQTGRILLGDDDIILLSVSTYRSGEEAGLWSANTEFATILMQVVEAGLYEGF
ncbi:MULTISPECIES: TrmB family transcriptional regulator [unclassified Haladaptatus]|uniref:TrmB family transcriptional regulator n=1 Tax=unclassified Haladaptatus TaxID=2622732 RepID=UPI002FCE1441